MNAAPARRGCTQPLETGTGKTAGLGDCPSRLEALLRLLNRIQSDTIAGDQALGRPMTFGVVFSHIKAAKAALSGEESVLILFFTVSV